jgi:uncharacterized protein (UPF0332 family)
VATAALAALGHTPSTRTGTLSAFGRQVVVEGGLDHDVGRILRRLFDHRNDVDYGLADAPVQEARAAVDDAERLLEATARWLEGRA